MPFPLLSQFENSGDVMFCTRDDRRTVVLVLNVVQDGLLKNDSTVLNDRKERGVNI